MGMNTHALPSSGLEQVLSVAELADYLGVPIATIYDWRTDGKGPVGIRVGRHVKFAVSDVRSWLESKREPTTTDGWDGR